MGPNLVSVLRAALILFVFRGDNHLSMLGDRPLLLVETGELARQLEAT